MGRHMMPVGAVGQKAGQRLPGRQQSPSLCPFQPTSPCPFQPQCSCTAPPLPARFLICSRCPLPPTPFAPAQISDRALVVAAELADRYITSRFLPDKAIDLVDEACSNLQVQLESKPEAIDVLERQLIRLQVRGGVGCGWVGGWVGGCGCVGAAAALGGCVFV